MNLRALSMAVLFGLSAEPAAAASFKKADAALNATYAQLMAKLSGRSGQKLKLAQRAWIAFRDAECALQGSAVEGGSAQPMVVATCMAGLTEQRVRELRAYLSCEEGDLACPR